MKRKIQAISPLKILAFFVLIYLVFGIIFFRLHIANVLPLFVSVVIMFLQSRVNRYAFLIGAFNSILYAVAYFYMTLYSSAAYALFISFPLQVVTFFSWQKNTRQGVTDTRSFTKKGRLGLFLFMALTWTLLFILFSALESEYLIVDNTVAVIGIVATLLCTMRHSEYAALQVLANCISIVLYSYMTLKDPGRSVWLVYSVYSAVCSTVAFIKMNSKKERHDKNMNVLNPDIKKIGKESLFLHVGGKIPRMGEGSFIRLLDGGILFAYTSYVGEERHDHSPADIAAVVSKDNGETWSEPRILLRHDVKSRNLMCPSLLRLKSGKIGMILLRKEGDDCIPHFSVSEDEGRSFSAPRPCGEMRGYYVFENDHAIMLERGRILVPLNHHEVVNGEICSYGKMLMLASDDDGETWKIISEEISSPFPPEVTATGLHETAVYQMPDGSIRSTSRTDLGCQWECYSKDEGATWSAPAPNRFFSSPDAPLLMKDVGPFTVAVFCPMPRFTTRYEKRTWGRTPIIAAVSDDKGKTFNRVFYLEDDLANGYGYPAIFDGGDYMLVSYYHSDNLDAVLRSTKILKIEYSELM